MIPVTGGTRLFLYRGRADMRKGFDGLSGLVEEHFTESLFSGALFVLLNRRRDRVKTLYWDSGGLALWYKRCGRGRRCGRKCSRGRRFRWDTAPERPSSRACLCGHRLTYLTLMDDTPDWFNQTGVYSA